jgi:hypothetical protein
MAMKKLLPLFVVCLVVVFMTPALASEVDSTVTVRELFAKADLVLKAKATLELKVIADIYVTRIDKCFEPDSRAMAEVVKKQINEDNGFFFTNVTYTDKIASSFNDFNGIGQINQAAGSMNNQANIVSAAVTDKENAWANAEVIDYQLNDHLALDPKDPDCPGLDPAARIDTAFNRFSGLGQVNQSPGMGNNQNNIVAIAFSTNGAKVTESDVNLDQINVKNYVSDNGITRTNTAINSFNEFTGIAQANQSAGNFNNQSNIVAFAGTR